MIGRQTNRGGLMAPSRPQLTGRSKAEAEGSRTSKTGGPPDDLEGLLESEGPDSQLLLQLLFDWPMTFDVAIRRSRHGLIQEYEEVQ